MALVTTTRERLHLVQSLDGMHSECQYAAVNTFEDNHGAIALSKNPVRHIFCTEWEPWIVLGHDLIYSQYEQKQHTCNINLCGT